MTAEIKFIKAKNDNFVIVDAHEYEALNEKRWFIAATGYAVTSGCKIVMHRQVSGAGSGQIVDHIDGDRTNNMKRNLRLCTVAENGKNRTSRALGRNPRAGVSFNKREGKWKAYIGEFNRQVCLGTFKTLEDALRARKNGESKYFGEFARRQ